nr:hypothetical protein [uncultured Rhodoferax sp.]
MSSLNRIAETAQNTAIKTLRQAMPEATLVEDNRFGGVAAGLAWAGAVHPY